MLFLFLVLSTLACEKERIDDKETMEDPNNTISENKAPLFSLASLDNGTVRTSVGIFIPLPRMTGIFKVNAQAVFWTPFVNLICRDIGKKYRL